MNTKFSLLTLLLIAIVFVSGCTSDKPYEQPTKVESAPTQTSTENSITTQQITTAPTQTTAKTSTTTQPLTTQPTQTEKPKIQTFKVGESASDGRLKITVNGVSFKDKITQTQTINEYTSSYDFKPKDGYQFLILDISIENLQPDKTSSISSLLLFKVSDADGYSYDWSIGTAYLDRKWVDGDILPGTKKRGSVAFEVPKTPNGLKFEFKFDFAGQTAVFNLQ